jgi:hypothetical protein
MSIASDRPLLIGSVIVSRCGLRGQYLATTRLIINPDGEIIDWGGRNHKLEMRIAPDPQVDARVKELTARRLRASMGLATKRRPPVPGGAGGYLGVATCRTCHRVPHQAWAATPHARAWETLVEKESAEDPACVACHATGIHPSGRPIAGSISPGLRAVQCEACHGPGAEHARGEDAPGVTRATCSGCHTEVWSPDWDFVSAMEAIRH